MGCQNENDLKIKGGVLISLDFLEIFGFFGLGWSSRSSLSHYARACAGMHVHVRIGSARFFSDTILYIQYRTKMHTRDC